MKLTAIKNLKLETGQIWLESETYELTRVEVQAYAKENKGFLAHFEPADAEAKTLYKTEEKS